MNNNDFLKAMSMIDDDLMHEADIPEKETGFSDEDGTVVSGVEVYHRPFWRKVLAAAAALVIIAGTAAGGAIYFSKLDKDTVSDKGTSSYSGDEEQYGSIYSKLKANSETFTMDTAVCLFESAKGGFPDLDSKEQEEFFDYMDKVDTEKTTDINKFVKAPRNIKFVFGTDEDIFFTFVFYENGCFSVTENDNGSETAEYYRSPDGMNCFDDLLKLYKLDTILPDWDDVGRNEIEDMLNSSYFLSSNSMAMQFIDGKTLEYEIYDKDSLIASLASLKWERCSMNDADKMNDPYYLIWGVTVSEDGYITGRYKDYDVSYKLKNESDAEKIINALRDDLNCTSSPFSDPTELLQSFVDEKLVQWIEGPMLQPQGKMPYDTTTRFYTITDARKIIDGLSELEWETTTSEEIEENTGHRDNESAYVSGGYYDIGFYGADPSGTSSGDLNIYPDGYMSIDNSESGRVISYFRLKNESDKDKLVQLIKDNTVIDECSEIAEKISNGITNYDNLRAQYTLRLTNTDTQEDEYYMSGELSVDARNEKLYQTGEGRFYTRDTFNEIVMNGHDNSACKVENRYTSDIELMLCYKYSNGSTMSLCPEHYIYLCKDIEKSLTPRFIYDYTKIKRSIVTNEVNGNTEIKIHSSETDYDNKGRDSDTTIVLTPGGQLLSYEVKSEQSVLYFTLDNYVFDSPDFTMADTQDLYDRFKNEAETQ